ncbi:MAG: phosphoribosyltransferase, partial [uncultured bacterium]
KVKIICPVCKRKLNQGTVCSHCQKNSFLDGVFFATSYENSICEELVKNFKYHHVTELKIPLSLIIIKYLNHLAKYSRFKKQIFDLESILIPIPLHKKRLKERGFNQSELLAKEIAPVLGFKYLGEILIRKIYTQAQAELPKEERLHNIKDCFELKEKSEIKGKTIILIDDVFTTGATLQEAAKVLKKGGAKKVWGLTIAHG